MLNKVSLPPKLIACGALCAGFAWGQLPAGFTQVDIAPTATFLEPTSMAFGNEGSVFISERAGNVKVIQGNTAVIVYHVNTTINREQGLLKIQVHPRFNQNGWLYLYYMTADYNHHNVGRITLDASYNVTRVDTLIQLPALENLGRHNGSGLVFGNDGYLYVSRGQDELTGAANPAALWTSQKGKILRFTELGLPAPGNPHYSTPGASVAEQSIWARGFRNPWTLAIDPISGRILEGDVGDTHEEINDVTNPDPAKGYWYGYGVGGGDGPNPTGLGNTVDPLYWHGTGVNGECAVVSEVPYNAAFPSPWPAQYKDRIYVSDYCGNLIRSMPLNPPAVHTADMNVAASGMQVFGSSTTTKVGLYLGLDGDLYYAGFVLGQNLHAYKIHYTPTAITPAPRLSLSGLFRVGLNSEMKFALQGEFLPRDLGQATFTVAGPDGRILFRQTPAVDGKNLRIDGFRPGRAGIFLCRLHWTSGGEEHSVHGLITVLP